LVFWHNKNRLSVFKLQTTEIYTHISKKSTRKIVTPLDNLEIEGSMNKKEGKEQL